MLQSPCLLLKILHKHLKVFKIKDLEKCYIAQVIKVQKVNDKILAFAKLLYLYDNELKTYDGSAPQIDSEISQFNIDKISSTFNIIEPILAGKFVENRDNIFIDKTSFNKKTIISAETPHFLEIVTSNIKQELSKTSRVFVIDMQGVIPSQKFVAGQDFRLPLNTESLEFMYEDCLNDTTADSKSLIKEIFQDLSDYSKTVPFLPFGALKSIVDDMVDNSHVFKLLVLKNKLNKFDKMGYFAINQTEAENLNKILAMQSAFIDLSKLDTIFQNRYLETIYKNLEENTHVIVIASNSIDKKNLKTILTKHDIASTFVTHPRFKYINEIKSMFKNFIIEPTFTNNEVFKAYSTFLNSMTQNTYLITGECTNYLPLISVLEKFPEDIKPPITENQVEKDSKEDILDELSEIATEENIVQQQENAIQEIIAEKDEQTEAIDKKSNELIEKISEDLAEKPQNGLSLFNDDDTSDNSEKQDIIDESTIETPSEQNNANEDFETISSTIDEDDLIEELAIEEPVEEIEEDVIEPDFTSEDVPSNIEEPTDEFHTVVDEIKAIDIPEDIIELTDEAEEEENIENEDIIEELPTASETIIENSEEGFQSLETEELEVQELLENENIIEIPEEITNDIEIDETLDASDDGNTIEDLQIETDIVNDDGSLVDEVEVMPINDDEPILEEIIELDESDLNNEEIIVEIDDFDEMEADENLDKEIIEDVDKVFTTIKDNSLSDNDLDLIDELNSEDDSFEELAELQDSETEELDFIEPIEEINDNSDFVEEKEILETKKSATTNVPVYDAEIPVEDTVQSDPIEQGDTVSHAKYGVGVVEKMIKYGNKTLFSINFDNVGRRLLDPTLTEIKKG